MAGFTKTLAKTDPVVRTQRVQNRLHGHQAQAFGYNVCWAWSALTLSAKHSCSTEPRATG